MPEAALEYGATRVAVPTKTVAEETTVDLGGRSVALSFLGRGHTDNDMVIAVRDARLAFAGGLVRQGGPPSFADSFPMEWPGTLARLRELAARSVVPGHGDLVTDSFVEEQRAMLSALAELAARLSFEGGSAKDGTTLSPFPPRPTETALRRALSNLAGRQ
jgi:glyoxylase-like metal-dependent hydrolase (beta-lactamase superfamily II)